jgi:hypothetical protein
MCRDTVIENHGKWGWTLAVTATDEVVARQPIPHDGALVYSTKDWPNREGKYSEYQLKDREVIQRFVAESETDATVEALIDDVQAALGEVPADA